jgi:hypothetical protein
MSTGKGSEPPQALGEGDPEVRREIERVGGTKPRRGGREEQRSNRDQAASVGREGHPLATPAAVAPWREAAVAATVPWARTATARADVGPAPTAGGDHPAGVAVGEEEGGRRRAEGRPSPPSPCPCQEREGRSRGSKEDGGGRGEVRRRDIFAAEVKPGSHG